MLKIVFIGAGSQFGAKSFVDLMYHEELRDSEVVLVDINPNHLAPVAAYARKVVEHYKAPAKVTTASNWRDAGVLAGADYVITSFAHGGPAYSGPAFQADICIPMKYGIEATVGDTVGIAGVFRTLRTAPELMAIGQAMVRECPGAAIINYVNPMSMLTRTMYMAAPEIKTYGLCHSIQGGMREMAHYVGVTHRDIRFEAAGVNHLCWFTKAEYLDGRSIYPDLLAAGEKAENYQRCASKFELLKQFGYWSGEGPGHVGEYVPYFLPRVEDRESIHIGRRTRPGDADTTADRWSAKSDLMQQLDGRKPLALGESREYGVQIIHAAASRTIYRMHLNVVNNGLIENYPDDYCVEVCCTADRSGVHPHQFGRMPVQVAALSGAMANMQTLASDAVLEKDLNKALWACMLDPLASACTTPAKIRACFNELLEAERELLAPYWGDVKPL